jgi:hypothetical protein
MSVQAGIWNLDGGPVTEAFFALEETFTNLDLTRKENTVRTR